MIAIDRRFGVLTPELRQRIDATIGRHPLTPHQVCEFKKLYAVLDSGGSVNETDADLKALALAGLAIAESGGQHGKH